MTLCTATGQRTLHCKIICQDFQQLISKFIWRSINKLYDRSFSTSLTKHFSFGANWRLNVIIRNTQDRKARLDLDYIFLNFSINLQFLLIEMYRKYFKILANMISNPSNSVVLLTNRNIIKKISQHSGCARFLQGFEITALFFAGNAWQKSAGISKSCKNRAHPSCSNIIFVTYCLMLI